MQQYEQMELDLNQDSCCGKMSKEHCQVPEKECRKAQTFKQSSQSAYGSSKKTVLLCLFLRKDGLLPESSWETDGALLGKYQTYKTTDSHNEGKELLFCATSMDWKQERSCLSNILQDEVDDRYYLSARACQGILNRAEQRGKPLPAILRKALEDRIHGED